MTNKEAIEELKKVDTLDMPARLCEAHYMAIKALEQEPSGDLISRQAVFDLVRSLTRWCVRSEDGKFNNVGLLYDDVMFGIYKLPSVTPQEPKTDVIDKIRAEIEELPKTYPFINHIDSYVKEDDVKKIIDKYRKERMRNE